MGRTGIQDARLGVGHQGDGFTGSIIWQAEDDHVGAVDQTLLDLDVLAVFLSNLEQLYIGPLAKAILNLQTRGADLAINKNCVHMG